MSLDVVKHIEKIILETNNILTSKDVTAHRLELFKELIPLDVLVKNFQTWMFTLSYIKKSVQRLQTNIIKL